MPEEVSAPEVAAPAASAPVASEGGTATSTGHSAGGDAPPAMTEAPAPTRAEAPFDWGSWDGEVDSAPESHREMVGGISAWYKKQHQDRETEIDSLRSLYSAMLSGDEDPRVGELTAKLEGLQGQYDTRGQEVEALQAQFRAHEERAVKDYTSRFWTDHPQFAGNDEKIEKLITFLDPQNQYGGAWEGYVAAELLELPEDAITVAVEAKQDGVADTYALKLAKAHAQVEQAKSQPSQEEIVAAARQAKAEAKAKEPRTGAKITNGAVRSSRPQVAKKGMGEAQSLDEMRVLAARRALSVLGGGRK